MGLGVGSIDARMHLSPAPHPNMSSDDRNGLPPRPRRRPPSIEELEFEVELDADPNSLSGAARPLAPSDSAIPLTLESAVEMPPRVRPLPPMAPSAPPQPEAGAPAAPERLPGMPQPGDRRSEETTGSRYAVATPASARREVVPRPKVRVKRG